MSLSSIGTTLSVTSTAPATFNAAGYAALTFTEVLDLETLPAYGPSFAVVERTPLKDGITRKSKGALNYGSMSTSGALTTGDAGQAIMKSGVDGAYQNADLYFKVEYNDGSVRYLQGSVFSFQENVNAVGSNIMFDAVIELNAKPIGVDAA